MKKEDRFVAIENLLQILNDPLVVVDVGVRWGFQEHWERLGSLVQLIGLDADKQEIQLLSDANQGVDFIPKVLGAQNGWGELYITQDPACSSLYAPDEMLIRNRPSMYVTKLVSIEKVEIITLDSWARTKSIPKVDFMKLDVQGAELDVLKGAEKTLQSVRMLEVEIQFNPLYQGAPLFGEVDKFLRERGFSLWRINNLCHYGLSDFSSSSTTNETVKYDYFTKRFKGRNGQLYWADAYYIRNDIAYNFSRSWKVALYDACMARILDFEDLFVSSLKNSLATCPPTIRERIRKSFMVEDVAFSLSEAYQISLEADQPKEMGCELYDEYIEIERIESELETLRAERDQAIHQLNAFYHTRAYKLVSALQSIYHFLRKLNKN